jgi:hypothetical protein
MRINNKHLKVARGSLTIEAALVLPIFIYIIIAFVYFLQIIGVQENLQNAITETGFFTAKYAYVYDYISEYEQEEESQDENTEDNKNTKDSKNINDNKNTEENKNDLNKEKEEKSEENTKSKLESSMEAIIAKGIDSTYYKLKMQDYLDVNKINHSCIDNGFDGVHTYLSSFLREDDAIDIILTYNIKLPLLFINIDAIPIMQRVRMRGWNGHKVAAKNSPSDTTDENEEMVYITETGTVYHLYKDCTYLNLSIKEVNFDQIENLRNKSGGKYKKCSICGDSGNSSGQVYITDTGDRYHWNLNCSGLKRTIITIPKSEVGDRSLCSRCAARDK